MKYRNVDKKRLVQLSIETREDAKEVFKKTFTVCYSGKDISSTNIAEDTLNDLTRQSNRFLKWLDKSMPWAMTVYTIAYNHWTYIRSFLP